ncbi:TRAP transporter small permease [Halomonas sp. H33-56]|uniref:TRAP transporter small permease protein n=1 Tax=Halomonas sp. RT37 TaxID=2950872 RepID=A0AAU7KM97_9GAMM
MSSLRSLQAWLQRLSNGVNRLAIVFCVGCVLAMLGISFTGFLYTLFTGGALSWTYSLARLFLPWIGLISSTIALHSGEHVAMTLLVKLLPRPLVVLAAGATLAVIGALAVLMMFYGWDFFSNARQSYMVSDSIQISYKWTTFAVPLTGAIIALHLVHGFALLEHFIDSDAVIEQAIHSNDNGTGSNAEQAVDSRVESSDPSSPQGDAVAREPRS